MASKKVSHAGHQPTHGKRGRANHFHGRGNAFLADFTDDRIHAAKGIADHATQSFAFRGKQDFPGQSLEHGDFEPTFKLLDLLAYGALGDVKFLRCTREAAATRNGLEAAQPGQ
ncbi:hypothetical protein D3C72_1395830 [compost metagenome]